MKYNKIIVIVFLLIISKPTTAQNVTMVRQMRYNALQLFEEYTSCLSKLDRPNDYTEQEFINLFDDNATIYNDILPYNKPQELTPQEYFNTYYKKIKFAPKFSDLELGFPKQKNDGWQIEITFNKTFQIKSTVQDSVTFTYPPYSFSYVMTINIKNDIAKINTITVDNPLEDFFIIQKNSEFDLKYNDEIINDWEEKSNSKLYDKNEANVNQITIEENSIFKSFYWGTNALDNHIYEPHIKKLNTFGLGVNYSPIDVSKNTYLTDISQNNSFISLECFYGLQIFQKQKSTLFLNFKFNFGNITSISKGNYYTEYQSIDSDNDPYLRKINISSLKESMQTLYASIPISLEYLIELSPSNKKHPVFLSIELGGYIGSRLYTANKFNFTADYTGFYPQYFGGVEFDHYYDYGHYNLNNNNIKYSVNDKLSFLDYGVQGAIGVLASIDKNNLLKFNAGYRYDFQPILKFKENMIISTDYKNFESTFQTNKNGFQNIYIGLSWVTIIGQKK